MSITIKGGCEPPRNSPCPCGSGLSFKICHGDVKKRAVCEAVVRETMLRLITQEQFDRGLINEEQLKQILEPSNNDNNEITLIERDNNES